MNAQPLTPATPTTVDARLVRDLVTVTATVGRGPDVVSARRSCYLVKDEFADLYLYPDDPRTVVNPDAPDTPHPDARPWPVVGDCLATLTPADWATLVKLAQSAEKRPPASQRNERKGYSYSRRPHLETVLLQVGPPYGLTPCLAVACDGFVLTVAHQVGRCVGSTGPARSFPIPAHLVGVIARLKAHASVYADTTDAGRTLIALHRDQDQLIAHIVVDAPTRDYPDWKQIVPRADIQSRHSVMIDRAELLTELAALIALHKAEGDPPFSGGWNRRYAYQIGPAWFDPAILKRAVTAMTSRTIMADPGPSTGPVLLTAGTITAVVMPVVVRATA